MKTVKDFKDAGLVFVNNDIIGCVNSDPDSGGITIGDATRNGELPIHNAWNVREFAWREKTSIMLGFIGKIECINERGKPLKGPISYFACTKWRPLLKQNAVDVSIETPEEKEALDKIFGADSAPKPRKTVWDAVSELRGVLNNTYFFDADDIHLYYRIDGGYFICSTCGAGNDNEKLVCTTAEFNALVEEMTLGLDVNPVSHGCYMHYICADKVLLKKEVKPLVYTQGMVDDGCQVEFGTWSYTESGQCLVADKSLLKKGSTVNKPLIYTQEMYDNGELPSVGMECMYRDVNTGNYILVEVMYISEWSIVIKKVSDGYGQNVEIAKHVSDVTLKPVNQRTKKEKAIDELSKEYHEEFPFDNIRIMAGLAYDKWVGK